MKKDTPPRIQKFSATKQKRLDLLLDKNGEGSINSKEKAELEELVAEAEQLMVANAKRLAEFSRTEAGKPSKAAVPVTVWVQPQRTGR